MWWSGDGALLCVCSCVTYLFMSTENTDDKGITCVFSLIIKYGQIQGPTFGLGFELFGFASWTKNSFSSAELLERNVFVEQPWLHWVC